MHNLLVAGVAALALGAACQRTGTGGAAPAPAAAIAAGEPCAVPPDEADSASWRTVTATGFTFCAPPGWTRRGDAIRRGVSAVRWGRGEHPRTEVEAVVRVPAGSMPTGSGGPLDNEVRRFTEAIGGLQADVWRNRFGRNYYTGAEWTSAAVWLVGEARDSRTADLEVVMYRTVRFERP